MEVDKETAESVPGGAALKFCQGCRSQREGEGGGNKVNIGMGIRRQELILSHEKSTLSPLSLPPRIPQPRVSPGFSPFSASQTGHLRDGLLPFPSRGRPLLGC